MHLDHFHFQAVTTAEVSVKTIRKQTISVCLISFAFNPIKLTKHHIEQMQVQR